MTNRGTLDNIRLVDGHRRNSQGGESSGDEGVPTLDYDGAVPGPGGQIGPYKLLRILGEGGYGVVYLAEQQRPVKRRVALKVIKPGMDTKQVIARFEAERQALALLDHPNIAHVFSAGSTDVGRPYFAMEYVKGVPVTEHSDRCKLTIEERLRLFLAVCEAVQHAHQKAIIHRDIKPSNILVAFEGKQAVPMIIDFGVAKALSQPLTERTLVTEEAQMIGTPEYMSPEQAEMTGQDIDTRTDIYSLGVVLYELLTGTLPFDPEELREGGIEHIRHVIREEEPKTPSTRLSTVSGQESTKLAQLRGTDGRTLGRRLHGDLDWITLKAMEKDRTRRYETAHALAKDIERFLNDEPVEASPPSTAYRLRKFVRRNKGLVAAVLAVAITLLLGIIGTTTGLIVANSARTRAVQSAAAERLAKNEAEEEAERNRRLLYVSNMNVAMQAWEASNLDRMIQLLDQHRQPEPGQQDLRGFEWYYLWRLWQSTFTTPILAHEGAVPFVAFSADGKTLASASGRTVRLWDMATGEQRRVLEGHTDKVYCVAFSPDGKIIASGSGDKIVILWDPATGGRLHTLKGHNNPVRLLVFNQDGTTLFSGNPHKTSRWDVVTGEEMASFEEGGGSPDQSGFAALSPDGEILVVRRKSYLDLRDVVSGHIVDTLTGYTGWILCAAFSPDGKTLATGSNDSTVRLWDLATKQKLSVLRAHAPVSSVAFSPDGGALAASCEDSTVKLWDTVTDQVITLKGHASPVSCVAFSPDGNILASSGRDNSVRLWDTTAQMQDCEVLKGHTRLVFGLAISPDGKKFASASHDDGTLKLWTTTSPPHMESFSIAQGPRCVAFSPNGKTLAIGTAGGAKLWDIASRSEIDTLPGSPSALAFSPDGKNLATSGGGKGVVVWDVAERRQAAIIEETGGTWPWNSLAFSPDSKTLAFCNSPSTHVRLWDVVSKRIVGRLKGDGQRCVAFSPDGKTLASGDGDGTVRIWNVATLDGSHIILKGHMVAVNVVAFSPDGNTLASGSWGGTVKLWNLTVNQEVATLRGHTGAIGCLTFSPDGNTLITSGADTTIRLWRAATEADVQDAATRRQHAR